MTINNIDTMKRYNRTPFFSEFLWIKLMELILINKIHNQGEQIQKGGKGLYYWLQDNICDFTAVYNIKLV